MKLCKRLAILGLAFLAPASWAGLPVIDGSNLVQSIITAKEEVVHTAQQAAMVENQIRQLENDIRHFQYLARSVKQLSNMEWRSAGETLMNLRRISMTTGSIANRSADVVEDIYSWGGAVSRGQLPESDRRAIYLKQQQVAAGTHRASLASLKEQQRQMELESAMLERLMEEARTPEGEMQALQYGHQLAAHQIAQLQQTRMILMQMQESMALEGMQRVAEDAEDERIMRSIKAEAAAAVEPGEGERW